MGKVQQRARMPRAEREQQILDSAHALFAERGFSAVTMDVVAAEVGVTKPLLYAYFGNKDRLYLACMERAGDAMLAAVLDAIRGTDTTAEALRHGIHAFFAFVESDRDAWRVLFDESQPASGEVAQAVAEYRERLTRLIAEGWTSRRRRERARAEALSVALLGAAEALARWWLRNGGGLSAAEAADLLVDTLEPGLTGDRR